MALCLDPHMLNPSLMAATLLIGVALAVPALAAPTGGGERLEQADADHDGVVTRQEFLAARAARFERMDRNHDEVISTSDFPRFAMRGERGDRLKAFIAAADLDHDGRVTREELAQAPTPVFDRADLNHDGRLDRPELTGAHAR